MEATIKASEANIIRSAIQWWESRRPEMYTTSDHINMPTVKVAGNRADEKLATAVAKYLELKLTREKRRAKK